LSDEQKEDVQRAVFQITNNKLETSFDPLKIFKNDLNRMKQAYNGHDVRTREGMLAWQLEQLPLLGPESTRYVQDEKLKAFKKFSTRQKALLIAAGQDGALQAVDEEEEQEDDEKVDASRNRYYAYQSAMGGTTFSVGPDIATAGSRRERGTR
jgi:hypothetical protein